MNEPQRAVGAREPADVSDSLAAELSGLTAATRLGIRSDDLAGVVFVGKLVALREREDPDLGREAVHFPRVCY
jgi:hypothetical protein